MLKCIRARRIGQTDAYRTACKHQQPPARATRRAKLRAPRHARASVRARKLSIRHQTARITPRNGLPVRRSSRRANPHIQSSRARVTAHSARTYRRHRIDNATDDVQPHTKLTALPVKLVHRACRSIAHQSTQSLDIRLGACIVSIRANIIHRNLRASTTPTKFIAVAHTRAAAQSGVRIRLSAYRRAPRKLPTRAPSIRIQRATNLRNAERSLNKQTDNAAHAQRAALARSWSDDRSTYNQITDNISDAAPHMQRHITDLACGVLRIHPNCMRRT